MKKTVLICNPRTGSQLLVNGVRCSDCNVATDSAEIFCTAIGGMPFREFLKDSFEQYVPIDYWSKHSDISYIERAFERCDFFKLLYYHISDKLREDLSSYRIIHLKRKRLLSQYVSGVCAKKIGWGCDSRFNDRVHIDTEIFLDTVKYYLAEWSKYDSFENRLELFYEDGIDHNLALACEFIGVDCPEYSPSTIKVVDPDLSNVIENYEELRKYDIYYS